MVLMSFSEIMNLYYFLSLLFFEHEYLAEYLGVTQILAFTWGVTHILVFLDTSMLVFLTREFLRCSGI